MKKLYQAHQKLKIKVTLYFIGDNVILIEKFASPLVRKQKSQIN